MKYYVYDIELDFDYQPNSDIYTAIHDKEMYVDVPDEIIDVEDYIADYIIHNIEVSFDTPDDSDFEIGDAIFLYEKELT